MCSKVQVMYQDWEPLGSLAPKVLWDGVVGRVGLVAEGVGQGERPTVVRA